MLRRFHIRWRVGLVVILLAGLASDAYAGGAPNLVPDEPTAAPIYWCTWYAQNYWVQRGGEVTDLSALTNVAAREMMNQHNLFNAKDGWATSFLPRARGDYYFLIDHGWQVKEKSQREPGVGPFFSLHIDTHDFPEFAGLEPQEALRRFNDQLKALGWRGLALWVRGELTPENAEKFVKWSKYAGVKYWKIDGGDTGAFNALKAKQKFDPELTLEYAVGGGGNLNPHWDQPDRKAYPSVFAADGPSPGTARRMLAVVRQPVVFRTYDATPLLMTTTTLRRVHDILSQTAGHAEYLATLNVQDDCSAAAGLGCLVGSMRHPNYMQRTYKGRDLHHQLAGKRHMQARMDEPRRYARWSRIAPAFPAGVGSYQASSIELIDDCPFTPWDTWNRQTYGKTVYQSAPAIMSRNMPLPTVDSKGEAPYVLACKYPGGAVCVATEGRVSPDDQWRFPRAHVTIHVDAAHGLIGVFGHYESLTIQCDQPIAAAHIWAQDLLADHAVDIRDKVTLDGKTLTIPGDVIDQIGTSAADPGDISDPGLVLRIDQK